MVWSQGTDWIRGHRFADRSAKQLMRDLGLGLAVIAGFAAVALLVDFCVVSLWQAVR